MLQSICEDIEFIEMEYQLLVSIYQINSRIDEQEKFIELYKELKRTSIEAIKEKIRNLHHSKACLLQSLSDVRCQRKKER